MKKLLLPAALGLAAPLALFSCAPAGSNTLQHNGSSRVYSAPDSWTSGGHYTGFRSSRPSAQGFNSSPTGAPC